MRHIVGSWSCSPSVKPGRYTFNPIYYRGWWNGSHHTTSCKKEPISIDTLAKIAAKYATPDSELKDLRTALLCVLRFSGLFRASELTSIKAKDRTVNPDHLIIFVPTSKTDRYRNGNQVFIAQTNRHLCPHALLLCYLSLASIHPNSDEYIFTRSLQASRYGITATALASKRRLSYTRLCEIIKETISSIGLDPKQYTVRIVYDLVERRSWQILKGTILANLNRSLNIRHLERHVCARLFGK
jgi:hypothetical protein